MTKHRRGKIAAAVETCLVAALLAACTGRQQDSELKKQVRHYCHDLAFQLGKAAEKYAELTPALDGGQISPDQRTRIESSLMIDAIGATYDVRVTKMIDMHGRFLFCTGVRKIGDKRRDELQRRVGTLLQTLREQCFDATVCRVTPHAEAVRSLNELAAVAREIDELPLVE